MINLYTIYMIIVSQSNLFKEGNVSSVVRHVDATVVDTKTCHDMYLKYEYDINEDMICAGERGKGACHVSKLIY